jgi:hypothetical protein
MPPAEICTGRKCLSTLGKWKGDISRIPNFLGAIQMKTFQQNLQSSKSDLIHEKSTAQLAASLEFHKFSPYFLAPKIFI